jgi:FkbM family methyltransferase
MSKLEQREDMRCNGVCITYPGRHGLTLAEENFLKRIMPSMQSGVFFDVGANAGNYSSYVRNLAPKALIYAFEPHPSTFRALKKTAESKKFTAVNKAVSASPGQTVLYDFSTGDGSTQASLSKDAVQLFSATIVAHEIECTSIDDFLEENRIAEIDFLKIDTEGLDLEVLKGSRIALSRRRIKIIQFEFVQANITARVSMRDFFEVLSGHHLYRLCLNGGLMPIEPYDTKTCEIFATQNIIALPA